MAKETAMNVKTKEPGMTSGRKLYLDILKVLSIISVLYVHTGNDGMHFYENSKGIYHYISFFFREYAHTCSYMFFMISGALLLKKEEPLKLVLKKRVLRYALLIFIAGSCRLIYYNAVSSTSLSFGAWFRGIYSTNVLEQYWFLHAYLAFLIMLPFLRMIARGLKKDTTLYLLILLSAFSFVVPYFEILFDLDGISISLPILTDIVILPLAGYCLEEIFSDNLEKLQTRMGIYLLAVLALVPDLLYTYRMYKVGNLIPEMNGSYMLMTIGLYVLGRRLFSQINPGPKMVSVLSLMGSATLTIIVFEPEIRTATHPVYQALAPYISWLPALILWLLAAVVLGSLLSWVLKKIPGIRKLF